MDPDEPGQDPHTPGKGGGPGLTGGKNLDAWPGYAILGYSIARTTFL